MKRTPVEVIDASGGDTVTCDSLEEAIAVVRAQLAAAGGGYADLHMDACAIDEDGNGCTCTPVVLEVDGVDASERD